MRKAKLKLSYAEAHLLAEYLQFRCDNRTQLIEGRFNHPDIVVNQRKCEKAFWYMLQMLLLKFRKETILSWTGTRKFSLVMSDALILSAMLNVNDAEDELESACFSSIQLALEPQLP